MPRSPLRIFGASTLLSAVTAGMLFAQPDATHRTTSPRWEPFLGCWSTSSAGAVGPMVCVVPTDAPERVEFLTVADDSIVARTFVDASGRYTQQRRGSCHGIERGRWAPDSSRVLIQADYRCGRHGLQSDAILDLTHRDAFTFIEGTRGATQSTHVTNFIVQLDTTVFPVEVKRRLPSYRPLSLDVAELETPVGLGQSTINELASYVPFEVMDAWMRNRGESAVFVLADRRVQKAEARRRQSLQSSLVWSNFGALSASDANVITTQAISGNFFAQQNFGAYALIPANVMIQPSMVNFGRP